MTFNSLLALTKQLNTQYLLLIFDLGDTEMVLKDYFWLYD